MTTVRVGRRAGILLAAAALACGGAGSPVPSPSTSQTGAGPGRDDAPHADAAAAGDRAATAVAGGGSSSAPREGELVDPHGFALRVPASLEVLPEEGALPATDPPLLARLRLQDRELAHGDTAALEPPALEVQVFPPTEGRLSDWLQAHGRMPAGAGVESIAVAGAREALRVRDPKQLAPNVFDWIATERAVYSLVALGAEGEQARESFRLTD